MKVERSPRRLLNALVRLRVGFAPDTCASALAARVGEPAPPSLDSNSSVRRMVSVCESECAD